MSLTPFDAALPPVDIYTPTRLNQAVRRLLEGGFPLLWLEGEVSNLARPASGHCYFSLKDAQAQVRCTLFRNRALLFEPLRNGQQVRVRARVSLYEPRGDFQLQVEQVEDAGEGALRRAFDALRRQLQAEGLFAPARKRPLPVFPRRVGVITSATGAALRDVLSVLGRRFPGLPVLIYPTPVQGEGAGQRIAQTIALASSRRECAVLLLVRGGGSLEDLWAFNEEVVARAIVTCDIPLVCGVGHETDVTIADFAADVRAPTPSAAAELVSVDAGEWQRRFGLLAGRLTRAVQYGLNSRRQTVDWLDQHLRRLHPEQRLAAYQQTLDELHARLHTALHRRLEWRHHRLASLATRLRAQTPRVRVHLLKTRRRALTYRLHTAIGQRLHESGQRVQGLARALHAVSPLQTLGRGYALVRQADGTVVREACQLAPGDAVSVRLAVGELRCRVEETRQP